MPNEIVDLHRKKFPGDKRTDGELVVHYTTKFGQSWAESKGRQLPNFYRDYRQQYYGDESEFLKGAERGFRGLQSTAMGGIGLALDAVPGEIGFVEDWKQSALKSATEYGEKASAPELAPREPEFKNVETFGQGVDYLGALFGEAAPSIAESVVVGAAGALAGSAVPGPGTVAGGITGIIGKTAAKKVLKDAVAKKLKGLTGDQVKDALAKKGSKKIIAQVDDLVKRRAKSLTSQYGALTANALNSYGLSSGEIYNELANDPDVDPDDAFNISITFGAIAAAPDTILPSMVLKRMGVFDRIAGIKKTKVTPKDRSAFMAYLTRFAPTAASATSIESLTEGFQEYVNISAGKYAKGEGIDSPFELTPEERGRLQRAAALGAAGGFMVSPMAAINVKEEAKDFETDEAKEDAEIKEISDIPKKKLVTPPPTTTALAPEVETNLKRLALLYVQGEALANPEIAAEIFEAKKDVGQRVRFNELVADYRRQVQLEALEASKEKELLTVADKKIAEGADLTEDEVFAVQQRAEGVRKKSYVDTLIKVLGNEPLDEEEVEQVKERGGAFVETDGLKFGTTPETFNDQETTDDIAESLSESDEYVTEVDRVAEVAKLKGEIEEILDHEEESDDPHPTDRRPLQRRLRALKQIHLGSRTTSKEAFEELIAATDELDSLSPEQKKDEAVATPVLERWKKARAVVQGKKPAAPETTDVPPAKEDPIDPPQPLRVAESKKGWWDLLSQKNKKLAVKLVERGEDDERLQKFIESAAHKDSPVEANRLEEFHNADEALRDPKSDIETRIAARNNIENGGAFTPKAISERRILFDEAGGIKKWADGVIKSGIGGIKVARIAREELAKKPTYTDEQKQQAKDLAATVDQPAEPAFERGSRGNIEKAGDDLGKRAAVAHGVRKNKNFEGASQEFKDYVNGIMQEAEAAGYEIRDATGKKWAEGTTAEPTFAPAEAADEALRLGDGEHSVIKKVNSPAVFKDGKLVGVPRYEVVIFGPKEAAAPETTDVPPTAPTTLEEDIDSVWDDVFPTLIEKFGKENLGIFNKERIAGVVGRLRAAEEAGDVAGMNRELAGLIGVIPRDPNDPAQMKRVEDVIRKEADRLLGGLEDSVLLDFIRKRKKHIDDAGRDWRESIVKSRDGSMMEEGEPAPVFSEALKRGLIDENGNETAATPTPPTVVDVDEATTLPAKVEVEYDYGETVTPFVETIKKTPPPPADEINKVANSDIAAKQGVINEQSDKINTLSKLLGDLTKEQAKLTDKDDKGKLTEDEQTKLDGVLAGVSYIQGLINKLTNSITLQAKRIENLKKKLVSEDTVIDADTGEVSTVGSLNEDSLDYESGITFLVQEQEEGEESAAFREVNKLLKGGQPAPAYYAIDPQVVATLDEALKLLAQEGQEVGDLIQPPNIIAQSKAFGKGASANTRRMTALYSKTTGEVFVVGTGKIVRRKSPDFQKTVFFFRSHAGRKKGYLTLEQVREQGDLIPFASMRLTSPRTNPVFHFDSLGKYQERMGNAPNRVRETSEAVARTQASIQIGDVDTATPSPDFVAAVKDAPLLRDLLENEEVMGELFDYIEDDAKGVSESTRSLINEAVARHISQQGIAGELQELGRLDFSSQSSVDASLLGLLAEALDATFALAYEQDNAKQEFIGRAASLQPSLLGQTGGDTARPAITVKRLERRLRPISPVNENEQVLSFLYQRLPQEALGTLNEGHLGAAAIVAGRVRQKILDAERAVPTTLTERRKLDDKIKAAEARELTAWAKENGLLSDGEEFVQNWISQGRHSGMEHRVYYGKDGDVHKAISTGATWSEYFERIALNNWLFPSARYEFNGFAIPTEMWKQEIPRTDEGGMPAPIALDLEQPQALVSQPFINHVRSATEEEVAKHMAELGYLPIHEGAYDFYNPDTGVVVQDIHGENASIDESGNVVVFDSVPYRARALDYTSEGQLEGLRRPPESTKTLHQVVKEFAVWHGSPHLFEQFLLERIGSGEGHQMFGWGLYFADRRRLADRYRRVISEMKKGGVSLDGKPLDDDRADLGPFGVNEWQLNAINHNASTGTDFYPAHGGRNPASSTANDLMDSMGETRWDVHTKDWWMGAYNQLISWKQAKSQGLSEKMTWRHDHLLPEVFGAMVNQDPFGEQPKLANEFLALEQELLSAGVDLTELNAYQMQAFFDMMLEKHKERRVRGLVGLKKSFRKIRDWWLEGGKEEWVSWADENVMKSNLAEDIVRVPGLGHTRKVIDVIRTEGDNKVPGIGIPLEILPSEIKADLLEIINGFSPTVEVNIVSWESPTDKTQFSKKNIETRVSGTIVLRETQNGEEQTVRTADAITAFKVVKEGAGHEREEDGRWVGGWDAAEQMGLVWANERQEPASADEAANNGFYSNNSQLQLENVDWGMFSTPRGWDGFKAHDYDIHPDGGGRYRIVDEELQAETHAAFIPSELIQAPVDAGLSPEEFYTLKKVLSGMNSGHSLKDVIKELIYDAKENLYENVHWPHVPDRKKRFERIGWDSNEGIHSISEHLMIEMEDQFSLSNYGLNFKRLGKERFEELNKSLQFSSTGSPDKRIDRLDLILKTALYDLRDQKSYLKPKFTKFIASTDPKILGDKFQIAIKRIILGLWFSGHKPVFDAFLHSEVVRREVLKTTAFDARTRLMEAVSGDNVPKEMSDMVDAWLNTEVRNIDLDEDTKRAIGLNMRGPDATFKEGETIGGYLSRKLASHQEELDLADSMGKRITKKEGALYEVDLNVELWELIHQDDPISSWLPDYLTHATQKQKEKLAEILVMINRNGWGIFESGSEAAEAESYLSNDPTRDELVETGTLMVILKAGEKKTGDPLWPITWLTSPDDMIQHLVKDESGVTLDPYDWLGWNPAGRDIVDKTQKSHSTPKAGAMALLEAGFVGTRFFDRRSRDEKEGTYNYVIFDESRISIVSRDGKKLSPTKALEQLISEQERKARKWQNNTPAAKIPKQWKEAIDKDNRVNNVEVTGTTADQTWNPDNEFLDTSPDERVVSVKVANPEKIKPKAYKEILMSIANNRFKDESHRALARELADAKNPPLVVYADGSHEERFSLKGNSQVKGQYQIQGGIASIVLNDWAVETSMDETMLHEALHHLTMDALTAPATPEQKMFARQLRTVHLEAVRKYNSFLRLVPSSIWETVVDKKLGLGAIERQLASLPSEAFTDLTREEATKISEILYASSQKKGVGMLEYGLSDVDEFASSLTNPDFQKLLNAMQASERTRVSPERRSLWDQIVKLFVDFFNASEGSLLESVVTEVLGYNRATLGQTIKFSPEEQVDPLRPSDEQVKQKFIATLQSLATSGVDVQVLTDGLNKQLGMYSDRAIQLVIGDLANPTVDNFRLLLHEAGHDLFGQFTPDVREVFHKTVQHLTDEELQVDTEKLTQNMSPDNPVFETTQEERLVDSVARELAAAGFDPSEAKSWVKKVLNYLRELYYRAYIEVQRALLGSENVNGNVARRYFLLRMQSHLTGNYTPNAITMMGGAPMTAEEFGQANRGDSSEVTKVYDFNTGIVELKEIPSTSVKNILWNSKRRVKFSEDGSVEEIPIDPQPLLSRQKAVEEYMQTFYEELYLMFHNSGENADGIGFEKFVKDFLKSYVPADEITKLVENGARADALLENLEETTARPKAAKEIYRRIELIRAAFENAKGAAYSRKAESSMNRAKRHADKMKEFQAKYTDLTTYTENIVGIIDQALKEYANETKTSKPHLVARILKRLDPKYKYKNYKAALEKARRKALNMEDVFVAMGNMDLDFENTAPETLALQIRTELAGTTLGSKVEDNVVIASVLGFAKRYPEAMILLQLRSDKNRGNVDRAIDLMLSDNSAGITEARRLLRTTITKTKEGERLHQRILNLKKKISLIFNYQEKLQNKVDAGVALEPAMRQRQEEISSLFEAEEAVVKKERDPKTHKLKVVGVGQWEPLHESWVFVPTKPDVSVDEMWNTKKPDGTRAYQTKIRLSATEDFGKITKIIQLQGEWLAANGEEGERHSKIKRQRDRLMEIQADFTQKELQQNFISRAIGDMASKLEGVGSAQSRQIARRLRKWVSYVHTYGGRVTTEKGVKWAEAMDNAMKATNASSNDSFMERFYDPFFTFAAENSHIIEMFPGNIAAAENEVLKRGKLYLSERTNGESDKAWPELEKLFRVSAYTNGYIVRMGEQMGVKVLDEIKLDGGGVRHIFRKTIGSPMFSLMRKLNDNTKDLFNHLNQQFDYQNSTPETALTHQNVRAAAEAGPEALLTLFDGRFDGRTMKEFVEPIINRPTGAFNSSREQGGIAYDPAEIASAWGATEGMEGAQRIIQFAYNLAQTTATSDEQMVDTVTGIMRVFPAYYKRLSTVYQGLEAKQAANPVPIHTVMDARMAQDFPAEWLSYSTYSEREMRYYAEALSYESAFGRDLVGIRRDFDALVNELEGQVIAYKKIYAEVMDDGEVSKSMKGRKISEIIKKSATGKDGENPRHYTVRVLKAAEKNLAMVKAEKDRFEQTNRNKTAQVEYGAAMELISSLTGATVQGLSTAITDLSTAIDGPFRKYGLSTFALSSLFKNVKYTALDAIGTLIQLLPVSWNVNADRVKRRTRLGMVDDDALVTFRQRYVGAMRDEFRSKGMTGKAMEAISRGINVMLQAGIGKAKNKDQLYTTLKAAPFTMFVNWQSAGVTDSTFDLFTDFVARAGEFFSQNPEAMANENYQLTAKDLGLRDGLFGLIQNEKAFDYIVNTMQQHGLSPTRLGREWVLNGKTNPLTDEHYRRIAALSATEMMLENTAVTQPSVMMSNRIMLAARPLLRWGVVKTADLAKALPQLVDLENLDLKDPNTRKALKAYRDFTLGMGMAIIPLSLAWAMIRDKYDEELVGKRANLMRFGEANPFFVMLDRLDRVGTFGMGGEVANTLLNMDNARQFGIDNRVFVVNSVLSLVKATGTWIRQGDATYATVGRPAMMALGFGGALQNFQLANNLLGADNFESRYAARVNVNNILRSAGKELELDVRKFSGGGALPTPMKPWMTEMVLSAYANDGAAFRKAYKGALKAAKAMGKEDPEKSVKASLTMYHPLRYVFRTAPLEGDFSKILRTAGSGRRDITDAIRLFNKYAAVLGIEPYMGKKDKKSGFDPFKRAKAPAGFTPPKLSYKAFSVDRGSALPF